MHKPKICVGCFQFKVSVQNAFMLFHLVQRRLCMYVRVNNSSVTAYASLSAYLSDRNLDSISCYGPLAVGYKLTVLTL